MEIDCNFQTVSKAEQKGQKHREVYPSWSHTITDRLLLIGSGDHFQRHAVNGELQETSCFFFFQSFRWTPLLNTAELPEDLLFGNTQLFVWKFEQQKIHWFCHSFRKSVCCLHCFRWPAYFTDFTILVFRLGFWNWLSQCKVTLGANFHWRFTIATTENKDM